jgi:hypothetical protein
MSFDIGLICYEDGDFATLSPSIVLSALEPFIEETDDDFWVLSFPDGGAGEMEPVQEDDDAFDLCISGVSGTEVFDAIYEIMRQTHTLLWWSGGPDMVTADNTIASHLPPDYGKEHGTPALVRSGADILAEIAKS